MSSRRVLKAANAIRQVVSTAILTELRDPRVKNVTVTGVEVSADMRQARVLVSVMGDEKSQNRSIEGLQNAAGFLQARIGERIETRYIPKLEFKLDSGVKNSIAVARILDEVLPQEKAAHDEPPDDAQQDAKQTVEDGRQGQSANRPSDADQPPDLAAAD
ncbi:MAG: 30S ribosome-binding factor RbfA [Pirellulales bacterium]|nr:30S ribosome-binding factor RbfA [Pirellulales bacterium]